MPGKYAAATTVNAQKSRTEIEAVLARYGASKFGYATQENAAGILFEIKGRRVRIILPLPNRQDHDILFTPTGIRRWSQKAQDEVYEQAVRQRWRALVLVIKAKLEAVESRITTLDDEFMSWIVLPDGSTVGERLKPELDEIARTGQLPPLLPGLALPAPKEA